jgi:hypothetical protein
MPTRSGLTAQQRSGRFDQRADQAPRPDLRRERWKGVHPLLRETVRSEGNEEALEVVGREMVSGQGGSLQSGHQLLHAVGHMVACLADVLRQVGFESHRVGKEGFEFPLEWPEKPCAQPVRRWQPVRAALH